MYTLTPLKLKSCLHFYPISRGRHDLKSKSRSNISNQVSVLTIDVTQVKKRWLSKKGFHHCWRSVPLFINSLTKETHQQARLLSAGMCPLGRGFLVHQPPPPLTTFSVLSLLSLVNVRSNVVVYRQAMVC